MTLFSVSVLANTYYLIEYARVSVVNKAVIREHTFC